MEQPPKNQAFIRSKSPPPRDRPKDYIVKRAMSPQPQPGVLRKKQSSESLSWVKSQPALTPTTNIENVDSEETKPTPPVVINYSRGIFSISKL